MTFNYKWESSPGKNHIHSDLTGEDQQMDECKQKRESRIKHWTCKQQHQGEVASSRMPFDQLPHNYVLHSLHYQAKEPDATLASFLNNKKRPVCHNSEVSAHSRAS